MINVTWDKAFKKIYKKKINHSPLLKNSFSMSIKLFVENPFDKSLRTHKLSGELKGLWAFSINYKYRVIFKFLDKNNILLIDLGTHDEVY